MIPPYRPILTPSGLVAAARGLPIYAECGGLMYLCEWLEDQHGQRYPQVGLIPGGTRMTTRLQQFGYAEATFVQDTLLGPANTTVRGHRFHYSIYEPGTTPLPCAYRPPPRSSASRASPSGPCTRCLRG